MKAEMTSLYAAVLHESRHLVELPEQKVYRKIIKSDHSVEKHQVQSFAQ